MHCSATQTSPSTKANWWMRLVASNVRVGVNRNIVLMVWLLAALGSFFLAYIARMHKIDHDAFHEMALFRQWLVAEQFPVTDVFAYTATVNPTVHHEWGTGAVLYFVTVGTGLGAMGLSVLKMLLIASLWLLLYRIARLRGSHPAVFALASLVVFPTLWVGFATIRAQLFTLVFLAAQLYMQELDWRGRRGWVVLWLIMLVAWLNMHAGFVVGLGMITIHTVERWVAECFRGGPKSATASVYHLLLAAPLAALATAVNPYGWDYVPYLIRAITMPRPLIMEWKPLWHTYDPVLTIVCFVAAVLMFAYVMRQQKRLVQMRGAASLAICTYMALKHIRHGSIFAIVWVAFVPAWFTHTHLGRSLIQWCQRTDRFWIRGCQAVVAVSLMFAMYNQFWKPSLPPRPVNSTSCYPSEAVEYLRQQRFHGNVLTPFQVGSYVSWQLFPQVKVSLDSRYEVAYREEVVAEHVQFTRAVGQDWWRILDKYPTDLVLVQTNSPVFSHLKKLSAVDAVHSDIKPLTAQPWEIVYQDDSYVLLASDVWSKRLDQVDRRQQVLPDRADEVFSITNSHWNRRQVSALQ